MTIIVNAKTDGIPKSVQLMGVELDYTESLQLLENLKRAIEITWNVKL